MVAGPETRRITQVFAGVPVSGLGASVDRYTRLFGRPRTVASATRCSGRWTSTLGSSSSQTQGTRATRSLSFRLAREPVGLRATVPLAAR